MSSQATAPMNELISDALAKIGSAKEFDLCQYLPAEGGGYMHHFTFRKLKNQDSEELKEKICTHVINNSAPAPLEPKKRAPRGSGKRKDLVLTHDELSRVLDLAKKSGDMDLLARFASKKKPKEIKRELIASIRRNEVDPSLWNSFCELFSSNEK